MVQLPPDVKDPNRALILEPPLERGSCDRCLYQEECQRHVQGTNHSLCESLSAWDLLLAERDGLLQETVWWEQLPTTVTASVIIKRYARQL